MSPRRLLPVILALLAAAPALRAQTIDVTVDGVEREVPVLERQGRRFVALETVGRLLGGRIVEAGAERAVLEVDDTSLVVRRRVPFVQHEGRSYQMVEPAQKDAGGFWLPASALHQLLPVLWPGRFPPVPDGRAVAPGGSPGAVAAAAAVELWVEPGRTRLGFRTVDVPGVTVDDALPGVLQIRLTDASLPAALAAGLTGVGLVDSAAVAPVDDGTALTLWLDPRASLYAVSPLQRPRGVEVVLRSGAADEAAVMLASDTGVRRPSPSLRRAEVEALPPADAAPPPSAEPAPAPPAAAQREEPPARARRAGGWRIVLDPGHGGEDPGAIGPGGLREKTVTLAVTRALKERLEREPGVEVVLTRDRDTFVPLGERTRMANRLEADLFVSVHANSAASRSAEGFETYFLSAAKTEDAKRVARMENAAIRYEDPAIDPASLDELNFILWDLAQNEYLRESSALAERIQEDLNRRLPLKSRGVKQAGFFVLNGAFMPAILFEMAFISNPREEALLDDPAFRSRLVDGLAESLLAYLDQYGRRVVASRSAR